MVINFQLNGHPIHTNWDLYDPVYNVYLIFYDDKVCVLLKNYNLHWLFWSVLLYFKLFHYFFSKSVTCILEKTWETLKIIFKLLVYFIDNFYSTLYYLLRTYTVINI